MCKRCGAEKPLSDYYADDKTCKECRKALVRANRAANIEHYRAFDKARAMREDRVQARKEWIATPEGKASKKKTIERYKAENPEKRSAHVIVGNAVRDGKLFKPSTCEHCKQIKRLEGHHDDYSKPLQVIWLCSLCHRRHHAAHHELED